MNCNHLIISKGSNTIIFILYNIAVVEMMAAGLITIAHRSGGPLMDIIVEDPNIRNGYLAVHDKE